MNLLIFIVEYVDSYHRLRALASCLLLRFSWYESNASLRKRVQEAILAQQVTPWRAHIERLDFRRNK